MNEIYVSTDIETNGPCPGKHSMLSLASVAFDPAADSPLEPISKFTVNLETLDGSVADPDTVAWWSRPENRAAWLACREDPEPVRPAMRRYVAWLKSLPGKPIFVGYPASFDFTFVYWYLHTFADGDNPFVRNAIDIETYAMAALGLDDYLAAGNESLWPAHWVPRDLPHTHIALDDAIEQGTKFMRMYLAVL
jgi:hypothetical protein